MATRRPRGAFIAYKDVALCVAIAMAKHGELTALVSKLAKHKHISVRAAWDLIEAAKARGETHLRIGKLFVQEHAQLQRLERELKPYPEVAKALNNLDFSAGELADLLANAKPSELHDILDSILRAGRAET